MSETNFTGGDKINHPKYYIVNGLECIDIIQRLGMSYELGSAFKYIFRAGRKSKAIGSVEDLQKARFFLEREIERQVRILRPHPSEDMAIADEEGGPMRSVRVEESIPIGGVQGTLRETGAATEGVDSRVTRKEAVRESRAVYPQHVPLEDYFSSSRRPI